MDDQQGAGLEALSWSELEQAVEQFIITDGPNTDDLPADEFLTLWARFESERRRRIVEVEGEVVGKAVSLSLAPSSVGLAEVEGSEIRLPDGTRIILHLKSAQPAFA